MIFHPIFFTDIIPKKITVREYYKLIDKPLPEESEDEKTPKSTGSSPEK